MTDYEELVYEDEEPEEDEEEEEEEEEFNFVSTYKEKQHSTKFIEKKDGSGNIDLVKIYIRKANCSVSPELITAFNRKIFHLNTPLLKKVVDKKPISFTVEEFRYYRFLEFLVSQSPDGRTK